MKLSIKISYLFSLCLLHLVYSSSGYFKSPLNKYIGDKNATKLFNSIKKSHSLVGILFTNKHCTQCHSSDSQLQQIILQTYNHKQLEIYRCQLADSPGLQQQFNIKRFPMLHFVLPTQNTYQLYLNQQPVTLQISNHLADKLMNYLKLDVKMQQKSDTLIVNTDQLVFIDTQDLINLYGLNPIYQQLPLMLFKNNSQFQQHLKEEVEIFMIKDCSIYITQTQSCFSPSNLAELQHLFTLITLQSTNQFSQFLYKHYQSLQLQHHVFIAVLDSIFMRNQSQNYLKMLNRLINKKYFKDKVIIFWMETQINTQKLEHLGFNKRHKPPLFAYFNLQSPQKRILDPRKGDIFNEETITKFIRKVIQIDEDKELRLWNYQILHESIKRLGLKNKLQVVANSSQINVRSDYNFILSLPEVDFEILNQKGVFYEQILSFNYLVKRIQKFSFDKKINKYLTFEPINCKKKKQNGFFILSTNICEKVSSTTVINIKNLSIKTTNFIAEEFQLPDKYWINEDHYLQSIKQDPVQLQWKHKQIDI